MSKVSGSRFSNGVSMYQFGLGLKFASRCEDGGGFWLYLVAAYGVIVPLYPKPYRFYKENGGMDPYTDSQSLCDVHLLASSFLPYSQPARKLETTTCHHLAPKPYPDL